MSPVLERFLADALETLAALVAILTFLGLVLRWMWRRWWRAPLSGWLSQLTEVNRQVTTNHHLSDPPTIRDQVDDIRSSQQALEESQEKLAGEVFVHTGSCALWTHALIEHLRGDGPLPKPLPHPRRRSDPPDSDFTLRRDPGPRGNRRRKGDNGGNNRGKK